MEHLNSKEKDELFKKTHNGFSESSWNYVLNKTGKTIPELTEEESNKLIQETLAILHP